MNGIEWLPRLPDDWQVVRISYICRVGTGEMDTVDADPEGNVPFYIRSPHVQRSTRPTGAGEAILTPGDGAVGEVFHHHRGGQFAAHQRVYVLSEFDQQKVEPRFFYWYFSSRFRMVTRGGTAKSTVESLRRPMFTSFPVVLPPLDEQRRIKDYLDRETATIDTLIEKQGQLRSRLGERRQAVIDAAFLNVRGLAPLRRHLYLNDSGAWGEEPTGQGDTDVLRSTEQTVDGYWCIDDPARRHLNARERMETMLLSGDLVVTKTSGSRKHIGKTTLVTPEIAEAGYGFGNFMQRLRTRSSLDPHFLWWFFRSDRARRWIGLVATTSTGLMNLNGTTLGRMDVPVPPLNEQRAIADRLDRETAKIDTLIAKAERFIELAQERRAALITAAVTGKIEIPAEEPAA